jgi:hypothetical protein
MNHDFESYISDAMDMVSAWEVPEEDFAQVVNEQAGLMAGIEFDASTDIPATNPYAALRF